MSVTLTQSSTAAFPDRAPGGTGLAIVMAQGNTGAYLEYELPAALPTIHCRFLLDRVDAAGGDVVLIAAFDAANDEIFKVAFDADARLITVTLRSGETLSAALDLHLAWHCIELKLAADAGEASLWINGTLRDEVSGAFTTLVTSALWLGGIVKETDTVGTVNVDEWVIASSYIGPVIVPAVSAYADDPTRWLVVYNRASDDSLAWTEIYRSARQIPYANLLGLTLAGDETISDTDFASLTNAITSYLASTGLEQQVLGILLGHGVPGYATFNTQVHAVAALLQGSSPNPSDLSNPLGADQAPTRPTVANIGSGRMTARIDGPQLADSVALVSRATTLMQQGAGNGDTATIWFDPYTTPGTVLDSRVQSMVAWMNSVERMRTRLPLTVSADAQPANDVNFDAIYDDGFFWGWSQSSPPTGFFAAPSGCRVFCFQSDPSIVTAPTLRSATPSHWVDGAIAAGYAAAAGAAEYYSASTVPLVRPFFEALRRGWTLGEAWFVSCPWLRDELFLVGDPLLTVTMPRAGWDVFGPLAQLEQLDPDNPSLALRESQNAIALPDSLKPAAGGEARYVLRHVDAEGRSEAGATTQRIARASNQAIAPPLGAVWPTFAAWPVRVESGKAQLTIHFDRPLRHCRIAGIALEAQLNGQSAQTLATFSATGGEPFVHHAFDAGTQSATFRWIVTGASGVQYATPWSATVYPASNLGAILQTI